eukprot:4585498-Prymnesium_polylepis.1
MGRPRPRSRVAGAPLSARRRGCAPDAPRTPRRATARACRADGWPPARRPSPGREATGASAWRRRARAQRPRHAAAAAPPPPRRPTCARRAADAGRRRSDS